jgi:hypothetical protein
VAVIESEFAAAFEEQTENVRKEEQIKSACVRKDLNLANREMLKLQVREASGKS